MHFAIRNRTVRANDSNDAVPIPVAFDITPIVSTSDVTQTSGAAIIASLPSIPSTFLSQALVAGVIVSPPLRSRKKHVTHALGQILQPPSMSSIIASLGRITAATQPSMDEVLLEAA